MFDVIIVNYNSTRYTNKLLTSLSKIRNSLSTIIIVDNNFRKSNFLYPKYLKVKIIKNKNNLGFAKAVNKGIKYVNTEVYLLINPDCLIIDDSPLNTFNLIKNNKNIIMAGGRIIGSNGTEKLTATTKPNFFTGIFEFTILKKLFPNNIFTRNFWIQTSKEVYIPTKVFSLCGAYMFIRKRKNAVFNEKYFLYLEDLDAGYIAEKLKKGVIFDPNSMVIHHGGKSSNNRFKTNLRLWYKSRYTFFKSNIQFPLNYILIVIFFIERAMLTFIHIILKKPYE